MVLSHQRIMFWFCFGFEWVFLCLLIDQELQKAVNVHEAFVFYRIIQTNGSAQKNSGKLGSMVLRK